MLKNILNHHHAILVEGEPIASLELIKSGLVESGFNIDGNPDIFFLSYQKFGIEDARNVIEVSLGAPVKDEKKIIVFNFESITNEAQNAFLKIFEDPSPQLKFIINTYTADGLLPTLRSRLSIIKSEKEIEIVNVESFMKKSVGEKMKEIERIVKESKDDGSKQEIKHFLLGIHSFLLQRVKKGENGDNLVALKATLKALDYLEDKSSSTKLLLESVVLVL